MGGPAEGRFRHVAPAFAAGARVLVAVGTQALALLVTPAGLVPAASAALAVTVLWGAVYLGLAGRRRAWPIGVDALVVGGFCLAQPWLDVPYLVDDGAGWVQGVAAAAVSAHPWQVPDGSSARRTSLPAALLISAAFAAGALLGGQADPLILAPALWLLVLSGVSRGLFLLLLRSATSADSAAARAELAEREVELGRARRDSEAAHLADVHDTAAATLLMVGLGAPGDPDWLRARTAHDLDVLTAGATGPDDLAGMIRAAAATAGVTVRVTVGAVPAVPDHALTALRGAVGEALRNVQRHAPVDDAVVVIAAEPAGVRIEIADTAGVPVSPEGLGGGRGIRESVVERMRRAGGRGTVTAGAAGVRVELTWPVPS